MSKLFDEFWEIAKNDVGHFTKESIAKHAWRACKVEAIRLRKEDIRTNIILKKQTVEEVLEDL